MMDTHLRKIDSMAINENNHLRVITELCQIMRYTMLDLTSEKPQQALNRLEVAIHNVNDYLQSIEAERRSADGTQQKKEKETAV